MKIETDDWVRLSEVPSIAQMPETVVRRLASDLGLVETFFGVPVMRRADIPTLVASRRRRGNQRWIASYDEAAADALRAVESRMKKQKATAAGRKRAAGSGTTDAQA